MRDHQPRSRGPLSLTAGEAWTREQLALLLTARFTPRGIAMFLCASSTRAGAVRDARPELARQADVWLVAGAAAWALPAALGVEPFRRCVRSGLGWWAATAAMLEWHLGMFETEDGRPCRLGTADALTLTRAWLVPVVADSPTPVVLVLGAATDVLDGVAARRVEPTRAGRDLEGLVDTCFSLAALRGLIREGLLSPASALAEAGRLVAGTGLVVYVYFGRADAPDAHLARAARSTSVLRFAGVIAAASGRRRLGDALVVSGALASIALVARAWRFPRSS